MDDHGNNSNGLCCARFWSLPPHTHVVSAPQCHKYKEEDDKHGPTTAQLEVDIAHASQRRKVVNQCRRTILHRLNKNKNPHGNQCDHHLWSASEGAHNMENDQSLRDTHWKREEASPQSKSLAKTPNKHRDHEVHEIASQLKWWEGKPSSQRPRGKITDDQKN